MKTWFSLVSALVIALGALSAAETKAPAPVQTEAEIIAKARPGYPLKTCVVTDEELSDSAVDYLHRETGKPDRLVRFCCEGCIDDFKADPAKFLKKIDAAANAQAPARKKS